MKKRNIYLIVFALFLALTLCCGCSMKKSGLYQINLDEETVSSEEQCKSEPIGMDTVEPEPVKAVFVHVCGEVINPGVYELESGSRVIDAVEAAGGFTENACSDYVNLASYISDGTKLMIPSVDDAKLMADSAGFEAYSSMSYVTDSSDNKQHLVDINRATVTELCEVNGIGETKAEAIVAYREQNGYYNSIEDIMNVSGIGQGTFSKIKDKITVGK